VVASIDTPAGRISIASEATGAARRYIKTSARPDGAEVSRVVKPANPKELRDSGAKERRKTPRTQS
jgi:hypothetical protein